MSVRVDAFGIEKAHDIWKWVLFAHSVCSNYSNFFWQIYKIKLGFGVEA